MANSSIIGKIKNKIVRDLINDPDIVAAIDCQIDGKKTKSKYVKMYYNGAVWGDNTSPEFVPDNELWDVQVFPDENDAVLQQIKGKFISNWYYLQFTFRTETQGDDFNIACFELKGITQETDTTGRK